MAELKTKVNDQPVLDFLNRIENDSRRQDCLTVMQLMQEVTGEAPRMWGESIVGFGSYHYRYASGREGDWMEVAFSPRKQNLTLYMMGGFEGYEDLRGQLGKIKNGKGCLYVNKLADINLDVLREMVKQSVDHLRKTHESG